MSSYAYHRSAEPFLGSSDTCQPALDLPTMIEQHLHQYSTDSTNAQAANLPASDAYYQDFASSPNPAFSNNHLPIGAFTSSFNLPDDATLQELQKQFDSQHPHLPQGNGIQDLSDFTSDPSLHEDSSSQSFSGLSPTDLSEGNAAHDDARQDADTADGKKKVARRQGVTCDQCRSKHLRCDLDERKPPPDEAVLQGKALETLTTTRIHPVKCSRCEEKGLLCTKTHTPPSRRYPRPSRTGKRIEQARLMHGNFEHQKNAVSHRINASTILLNALVEMRGAEIRITDRVMAGSLSLALLNCFFATAHMQTPAVDFDHFTATFNAANGDPRKMSIMSNGGSEEESIPAIPIKATGLVMDDSVGTKDSMISTPGTTETLIAVMHAWAAHFTDAPIAFGPEARELDARISSLQEVDDSGNVADSANGGKPTQRRTKRKQGVACDTCRLRRVRCDLTERPEGMGCSRCEDKKIKCTDEYIQSKKAKNNAGTSSSAPGGTSEDRSNSSDGKPAASNTESHRNDSSFKISPREWIASKRDSYMRAYIRGNVDYNLRRGRARKAFCHALLNHALALVHKHDLLSKPSVEAAQALTLLAPLMDMVDSDRAFTIADTACSHLVSLGLVTKHVVNEQDRTQVELLFRTMQESRLYLTTWCRDAISCGLNRRKAYFKEDRAVDVISAPTIIDQAHELDRVKSGELVLSEEMGLSFVFMALIQIGSLSRFIGVHIDHVDSRKPDIPSWQRPADQPLTSGPRIQRFSATPSLAEVLKLEKSCNAVWQGIDSLMLFFDRCAAKARYSMDKVKPFRPLGWIASTKISGSLLYLTIFRALGERYRTNAAYMATLAHGHGRASISAEDKQVAETLKRLFDRGMQKTLLSCRGTARMVEVLLPLGILQTGGLLLKQIFPVAQFLSKVPSVPDEPGSGSDTKSALATYVDPRRLSVTLDAASTPAPTGNSGGARNGATDSFEAADSVVHKADLGPYTHSAKRREVDACIEGLSQLGFAWDTMGREIDAIRGIMDTLQI